MGSKDTDSYLPYLPTEIVDIIIFSVIDDSNDDPTYQWMQLRRISYRYQLRVEKHFQRFWLPRLAILIQPPNVLAFGQEYVLEKPQTESPKDSSDDDTFVWFAVPGPMNEKIKRWKSFLFGPAWTEYSFTSNQLQLRLTVAGPSWSINKSDIIILNDTSLPGLHVEKDALRIRFDWRKAFDELLGEELFMQRVLNRMVDEEVAKLRANGDWPDPPAGEQGTPENFSFDQRMALLGPMVSKIQLERRVQVLNRRALQHDPSGNSRPSALENISLVDEKGAAIDWTTTKEPIVRQGGLRYSFLETVLREESMLFQLPGWEKLQIHQLWELLAWERAWRDTCLNTPDWHTFATAQRDEIFRQVRAKWWMQYFKNHGKASIFE